MLHLVFATMSSATMAADGKKFRRLGESKLRFQKKRMVRDGNVVRLSILQELAPVRYEDGTTGEEWCDVRSFAEREEGQKA